MDHAGRPPLAGLLHPVRLQELARQWLLEDTPSFDYGGFVVGDENEEAYILCKGAGVLAGAPFVNAIFKELDCEFEWFHDEGTHLEPICRVARICGKARNLLLGERVALNCLARMSGIATSARELFDQAQKHKWHGEIAGTRKTTPGFRLPEKYALLVGGISSHRYDLSSMVMIKDNHIWTAGNIERAVKDARSACGFSTKIEVECSNIDDADEAARSGADIVMLDNLDPESLIQTAGLLKKAHPKVLIEASGGITSENVHKYFSPNIDVISLSCTTQGYGFIDFSMKIDKPGREIENPFSRKFSRNTLINKLI